MWVIKMYDPDGGWQVTAWHLHKVFKPGERKRAAWPKHDAYDSASMWGAVGFVRGYLAREYPGVEYRVAWRDQ